MSRRTIHFSRFTWLIAVLILTLSGCDAAQLEQTFERIVERLPSITRSQREAEETPTPEGAAQSDRTNAMETLVYERINEIRQQEGLEPLKYNAELSEVARQYSQKMAEEEFFAHVSPDGSTPATRVETAGILYWIVGENLFTSTNASDPAPLAVQGWMDSPGHRENILRSVFTETGVGVWQTGNTYYFTQLFMRPL
jgi:uncharacterized protein YkwD